MSVIRPNASRILINLAAVVIVVAGMRAANTLIVRFLLGFFLSIICSPLFFYMQKIKIPKVFALIFTLVFIILCSFAVGALVGTSVNDFFNSWPIYQSRFLALLSQSIDWIQARGLDVSEEAIYDIFNFDLIINVMGNIFSGITNLMSDTFLILIMIIFVLLEASSIPEKIMYIWGKESDMARHIYGFTKGIQRYIGIKTVASLATGMLIAILMTIIGIDFPLLWGLLAFLLNFIPNIGSIMASVPPIFLALVQFGFLHAMLTLAAFLAVNMSIGNFAEPRILGQGLGLSPLVVFISIIFWGWVLGPIGMLLSVPLTMTVRIFFESREETRWLAVLLDNKVPAEEGPLESRENLS